MKTKASITIKNKAYPYTLEKKPDGSIRFVSKAAKIDQDFLAEDVSELILDLPNLIVAEQACSKKQSDIIRFRVSGDEKRKIEKNAISKGYNSVSSYLKDIALQ